MAPTSRSQSDTDIIYDVKNYFYIGNYQQCIIEAEKYKKPMPADATILRDLFTYRSYLAQNKCLVVLDEINDSTPSPVKQWKLLAKYLSSKNNREQVLAELDHLVANSNNEDMVLVAATIYLHENNLEAAYRQLHGSSSLEAMAFIVDILLKIDRLDLARKKMKEMMEKDDDSTITQLSQAWINIASGGEKFQEAYYILQELIDKYGPTPLLLNGQACVFIGQGKYEEAESALQEALDKDSNNPDTLVNMIVLHRHMGKSPEITNRYLSQLKDVNPDHPYVRDLNQKANDFKRICQQYSPINPTIPV